MSKNTPTLETYTGLRALSEKYSLALVNLAACAEQLRIADEAYRLELTRHAAALRDVYAAKRAITTRILPDRKP